jgi:hypothetical protein
MLKASDMEAALAAYRLHGNQRDAAASLGLPNSTFRYRLAMAMQEPVSEEFEASKLPPVDLPVEDLIEHRIKQFDQRSKGLEARKLIPVKIKLDGPIGIVHFGDPHVDDNGSNLRLLKRHIEAVGDTHGMFAANLGDLQNNWVGRLSHLWAQQSTSAAQAWQLTEWMILSMDWLYIVGGNHDVWSGNGDPIPWLMRNRAGIYQYHGVRVNLRFPNGKQVRVNARHDFHGRSEWNPAHGPMKAIRLGWRDHIATCGHTHVSFAAGPLKDPATGLLSWAIRCAGYKVWDSYADKLGLPDQNAFPACCTIIDPRYADDDPRLITVITDVEEGCDYLTWKRKRYFK